MPSLDPGNKVNTFEIRFTFRNTTNLPIRYSVESLDTTINGTKVSQKGITGVIPAMTSRLFLPNQGLSSKLYKDVPDRATGLFEISVVYGHAEMEFSRRATKVATIDVFKKNKGKNVSLNWIWRTDNDEAVKS